MDCGDIFSGSGKWPEKAYKNEKFLASTAAREVRVLCEFVEPRDRFKKTGVKDTVVFFGSARTLPRETAQARLAEAEAARESGQGDPGALETACEQARRNLNLSRYYEDARELARRMTEWSKDIHDHAHRFIVCSGGGPGNMRAANRGASEAQGQTAGLNISLPMEQHPNPYQTRELSFEFHYFFIRKFWFVYLAKALVAFPGGFGTFDELFEVLTLIQTNKLEKPMPVVIYGTDYWKRLIDFDWMIEWGMISPEDRNLFHFCDTVDEAFDFLKAELTRLYLDDAP